MFVCVGNACRSQMAEAFARKYGSDVIEPVSGGLSPANEIPDVTRRVMREKNIELDTQFPKPVEITSPGNFAIVVNMSGFPLDFTGPVHRIDWAIKDPMGHSEEVHRKIRDEVENAVMRLILTLRQAKKEPGRAI
ncbi:MAG TPA: low molecular weight phosphatase family protein [Solibacterales bacterium]|nr:low molecular weight phosphatase family protein [Bryobacterales bacterium]